MVSYYQKYLKYKSKYLTLQKEIIQKGGGKNTNLILFKAEWCGHCKAFKKTWEQLKSDDITNNINLITYDSNTHKEKINSWNIQGFPTLILQQGGTAYEYDGPREINNIKKFIEKIIN